MVGCKTSPPEQEQVLFCEPRVCAWSVRGSPRYEMTIKPDAQMVPIEQNVSVMCLLVVCHPLDQASMSAGPFVPTYYVYYFLKL